MELFKNIIFTLLLLSGCSTIPPNNQDVIVKHVTMYINSVDRDNDDIAAILKTYLSDIHNHKSNEWKDLIDREDKYINGLNTNTISSNYPIVPSKNEIEIADSFLDEISIYLIYYGCNVNQAPDALTLMSKDFIIRINDYEYYSRQNK